MSRPPVKDLMMWVKQSVSGYPDVSMLDMKVSWQNGLGFAAIIHCYEPDTLDYTTVVPEDTAKTIETVIKVHQEENTLMPKALNTLKIKVIISAEKMSKEPPLSLFTDQLVEYVKNMLVLTS